MTGRADAAMSGPARAPTSSWWRPYWGVLRSRWRATIAYRAAAIAGFTTQVFWGLLRVMYLEAFYLSGPGDATDFGFTAVLAYVWLGQALLGMFPLWNDAELGGGIRTGTIATELLRPVDLCSYWGWRLLAERVARMLPRAVLMLVVAVVVLPAVGLAKWRLPAPAGATASAMFALSALLSLFLGVAISMVAMLLMFWTVSSDGARLLLPTVVWFLGGLVIPLPLLPDPVRAVVELLPFASCSGRAISDLRRPYRRHGRGRSGGASGGVDRRPGGARSPLTPPRSAPGGGARWLSGGPCTYGCWRRSYAASSSIAARSSS